MSFDYQAFICSAINKPAVKGKLIIPLPRCGNKKLGNLFKHDIPYPLPLDTKINGTTFAEGKDVLSSINTGMTLKVIRMPDNPYDRNAIGVYGSVNGRDSVHLGFIPAEHAIKIAPVMDRGIAVKCVVTNVLGGGAFNIGVRIRLS